MRIACLVLGLTLLASCVTPPEPRESVLAQVFNLPEEAVWRNVLRHVTGSPFRIHTLDRDSGVVFAEYVGPRVESVLDCGRIGNEPIRGEATLDVTINVISDDRTAVRARVLGYAAYWNDARREYVQVDCLSTGRFEPGLLNAAGRP